MPGSRLSTIAFERRPADDEEVMTTTTTTTTTTAANDGNDDESGTLADDRKKATAAAAASSNAEEGGDDLTSLTWLQNRNLLQGCIAVSKSTMTAAAAAAAASTSTSAASGGVIVQRGALRQPQSLLDRGGTGNEESQRCHHHYNPTVHVCSKPPYSFSCLIFMAIEDSPNRALPVKDIYSWILAHFPYFQNAPTGWKNSVRHNLSLNKCFLKVDKGQNIAKGSLWCVDPEHRSNLLQALRKTPFKPFIRLPSDTPTHVTSGVEHPSGFAPVLVTAATEVTLGSGLLNPVLFPYLSRRLAATTTTTTTTTASAMTSPPTGDVEVDAAATMLSLKNGPRLLRDRSTVNGDRNYMAGGGGGGGGRSRRKPEDAAAKERMGGGGGKMTAASHIVRDRRHESRSYGRSVAKADREQHRHYHHHHHHHHQQQQQQQQQHYHDDDGQPSVTNGNSPHVDDHTYSSSSTTNSPVRATNCGDSPNSSIDEPFEFGGIATFATSAIASVASVANSNNNNNNNKSNEYARDNELYPSPPTSGGDSGVMRSSSSDDDDDDDDDEEGEEDDGHLRHRRRRRLRPESVRCPVIVRTVTTASGNRRVLVENEEERMKIVEGADALLNLAGFSSRRAAVDDSRTTTADRMAVAMVSGVDRIRRKRKPSRRHLRHLLPAALKARR